MPVSKRYFLGIAEVGLLQVRRPDCIAQPTASTKH